MKKKTSTGIKKNGVNYLCIVMYQYNYELFWIMSLSTMNYSHWVTKWKKNVCAMTFLSEWPFYMMSANGFWISIYRREYISALWNLKPHTISFITLICIDTMLNAYNFFQIIPKMWNLLHRCITGVCNLVDTAQLNTVAMKPEKVKVTSVEPLTDPGYELLTMLAKICNNNIFF